MSLGDPVAVLGGSFSGNKGAASMTYAVCDRAAEQRGPTGVRVFSPYPKDDRAIQQEYEIVNFTPRDMVVGVLPKALLSLLTARRWRPRRGPAGALAHSAVAADVSGIAFMDGRGFVTLVYNILLVLLPWAFGVPIVKIAQALGPFEHRPNRLAARLTLPLVDWIGLRGARTADNVARLHLTNTERAADVAFILDTTADARESAESRLPEPQAVTLVSPSAVVDNACSDLGINYTERMARLIDALTERGHEVVLLAHSARAGAGPGHTNDLPVCRHIAEVSSASLIDEEVDAKELRALIERSRLLITSRFHGMISGLATETPTFVIGWSHKYREVLAEFGLEDWAIDFREMTDDALLNEVLRLDSHAASIRSQIADHLPEVRESAELNIERLLSTAGVSKTETPSDLGVVIDNDLCIGCGACVAADPSISLVLNPEKLIFEPDSVGNELALAVCPAISVDYERLQAERFPDAVPGPFGVVESVTLAQSTDSERNRNASSGGIIKEVLVDYLGNTDVDGVIALGRVAGLDYEPQLLRSPSEVDGLPGSIYHNLPKHRVLEILREVEGKYVLVGIPCELEGIFSYIAKAEPGLADRIYSTVGLLCGWQYSHHALRAICDLKGIDFAGITDISYRGGGPVGKLRITEADGSTTAINRRVDFSYQVAFDRHFNTPRCHLCVNHANFLADMVVGDAWLPSTVGTKTGISIVISRTHGADQLLRSLADSGKIVLTDVTTDEIEESQTRRVAFGDFAYPYAEYLRKIGRFAPELKGPNRDSHRPVAERELEKFVSELDRKLALQRAGRYRFLRWRKATKELPKFLKKYIRWFLVRVLRIKSITGQRHEVDHKQLSSFR